jgi:hypothetical protein
MMDDTVADANTSAIEKASFVVYHVADGRRFRVHLRLSDFARLRVEKMRRTIAGVAKLDPHSFDIYIDAVKLDDRMSGFDSGLVPDAIVCLRPRLPVATASTTAAMRARSDPVSAPTHHTVPATARVVDASSSHTHAGGTAAESARTASFDDDTDEQEEQQQHGYEGDNGGASPAPECLVTYGGLNARQRALQERWLGEAVRSGVVASQSRSRSREHPSPSPSEQRREAQQHHAIIGGESGSPRTHPRNTSTIHAQSPTPWQDAGVRAHHEDRAMTVVDLRSARGAGTPLPSSVTSQQPLPRVAPTAVLRLDDESFFDEATADSAPAMLDLSSYRNGARRQQGYAHQTSALPQQTPSSTAVEPPFFAAAAAAPFSSPIRLPSEEQKDPPRPAPQSHQVLSGRSGGASQNELFATTTRSRQQHAAGQEREPEAPPTAVRTTSSIRATTEQQAPELTAAKAAAKESTPTASTTPPRAMRNVGSDIVHTGSSNSGSVDEVWRLYDQDARQWSGERARLRAENERLSWTLRRVQSLYNGGDGDGDPQQHASGADVTTRLLALDDARLEAIGEQRRLASLAACMEGELGDLRTMLAEATLQRDNARAAVDTARLTPTERATVETQGQHVAESRRLRKVCEEYLEAAHKASVLATTARAELEALKGGVRVIVRLRPPNDSLLSSSKHHAKGFSSFRPVATMTITQPPKTEVIADTARNVVVSLNPVLATKTYEFSRVYDDRATQQTLFDQDIAPLVRRVVDGVNACVLAYGQTGSGKTYTVFGADDREENENGGSGASDDEDVGFVERAVELIFAMLQAGQCNSGGGMSTSSSPSTAFGLDVSVVELHLDSVRDLLAGATGAAAGNGAAAQASTTPRMSLGPSSADNPHHRHVLRLQLEAERRCAVRLTADGAVVVGATRRAVRSAVEAIGIIREAAAARQVRETALNAASSRSHALVTLTLRRAGVESRLVVVDLAGSERVSRSLSHGDSLKEAQFINKSLSALGDVISARAQTATAGGGSSSSSASPATTHVPYRNSKLTALLQPCLHGAASLVVVIACIAPTWSCADARAPGGWVGEDNTEESLSTLTFASRARCVRNVLMTRPPYTSTPGAVVGFGSDASSGTAIDGAPRPALARVAPSFVNRPATPKPLHADQSTARHKPVAGRTASPPVTPHRGAVTHR